MEILPSLAFKDAFLRFSHVLAAFLVDVVLRMWVNKHSLFAILILLSFLMANCNLPASTQVPTEGAQAPVTVETITNPTNTPPALSQLNICLAKEPSSLFLYGDHSYSARLVRQAIYDGPYDLLDGEYSAVLLEKIPMLADGDVFFEAQQIQVGEVLVDAWGNLVKLEEGISYFPEGCQDFSCVQVYTGLEPVSVDQQVVRFVLKDEVTWSDAAPLSADDSLYSFEIAQALYPRVGSGILPFTLSYQVIDTSTVEWRGMPGYQSGDYLRFFFHPLPRHAWGELSVAELQSADIANLWPMGWGAFIVENWSPGEEIVLIRNPNYFRLAEGLPVVDQLVFRFVNEPEEALDALKAGECDLLDPSLELENELEEIRLLKQAGELKQLTYPNGDWEHLDFGINSLSPELPKILESKETRQAIAMCLDRQGILAELGLASPDLSNSFIPTSHPSYNPGETNYLYDPVKAGALLDSIGWLDLDANADTPRISQAVAGVEDGTEFILEWLTTPDDDQQAIARLAQESLAACGIQLEIKALSAEELFQPGPDGQIFGRKFQLAQFAWANNSWAGNQLDLCGLYTTQEIPGAYPEYLKGWGGANLGGYSNPAYDQACLLALRALPGSPGLEEHSKHVQSIFVQDLPALPLFYSQEILVTQPGLCGLQVDSLIGFNLWNIEALYFGEDCYP